MGEPSLPKDSDVNVEQIDKLPALLKELQGYVETHCIGQMTNIREHLDMSGLNMEDVDMKLNGQATPFGGFYSAFGIQAKADGAYKSVNKSLHELAKHLGKMIGPTEQIAKNYRTTEDRNHANMADIKKLLDAGTYTPIDQTAVDNRNETAPAAQDPRTITSHTTTLAPGSFDGQQHGGSGTGTTEV
ncbi:hypothetical protein ACQEVZ_12425 [Dactylosporangium sp. CA-152071]|uniref:hypothetical protein n=1 Tax=Dactylosporangium sp. CA-152071 TaxID=3239933 RepID=UPI003D8F469D